LTYIVGKIELPKRKEQTKHMAEIRIKVWGKLKRRKTSRGSVHYIS
jgi:hypothetical protein